MRPNYNFADWNTVPLIRHILNTTIKDHCLYSILFFLFIFVKLTRKVWPAKLIIHIQYRRGFTLAYMYNTNASNITLHLIPTASDSAGISLKIVRGIALTGVVASEQSLCWEMTEEEKKQEKNKTPSERSGTCVGQPARWFYRAQPSWQPNQL